MKMMACHEEYKHQSSETHSVAFFTSWLLSKHQPQVSHTRMPSLMASCKKLHNKFLVQKFCGCVSSQRAYSRLGSCPLILEYIELILPNIWFEYRRKSWCLTHFPFRFLVFSFRIQPFLKQSPRDVYVPASGSVRYKIPHQPMNGVQCSLIPPKSFT